MQSRPQSIDRSPFANLLMFSCNFSFHLFHLIIYELSDSFFARLWMSCQQVNIFQWILGLLGVLGCLHLLWHYSCSWCLSFGHLLHALRILCLLRCRHHRSLVKCHRPIQSSLGIWSLCNLLVLILVFFEQNYREILPDFNRTRSGIPFQEGRRFQSFWRVFWRNCQVFCSNALASSNWFEFSRRSRWYLHRHPLSNWRCLFGAC